LQELLDALRWAQMNDDTEANNDTEATNDKLWLDEEFRRLYPLSAQRLRDLAVQQQEDSEYRKYVDTLRSLQASAGELSEKEGLDLEFSPKDLQAKDHQVQGGAALVDHEKDDD
jgi:adenylate cyclase